MILVLHIIVVSITLVNFLEVKRTSAGEIPPLWIIPILLIVTVCIPIAIIVLCMFTLYRECIRIILKIKYGEGFGGLLNGPDAFQTTGEPIEHVINTVFVYQCPKSMSVREFYEILKERFRKTHVVPKFNAIFKKEFGYSYMLKASDFDTSFRKMRLVNTENHKLSKTELMLLINEYANARLPKDDTVPWEILVGRQAIEWSDDTYNYYFTLARYHHAIGDGRALMKLTVATYADKKNAARTSSEHLSKRNSNVIMKFFKIFCETFLVLILIPSWCVSNFILKGRDKNILKGNKLSKQSHYAMNIEDHSGYVQKVKRIKRRIPGVSFPDVLLTATSASLNEFFTKNSAFTEKVTVILPVLVGSTELLHTREMKLNDIKMQNDFSALTLDLPICVSSTPHPFEIINRLNLISKKTKVLKSSLHYSINRLIANIVWACLPQPLLAYVPKLTSYTAILSFLPGIPKITCFDGSVTMSNLISWNPHAFDIGSTILINTYDDRLHISASIDKALIENYGDVQEIADNILKYLNLLEEETSKYCAV